MHQLKHTSTDTRLDAPPQRTTRVYKHVKAQIQIRRDTKTNTTRNEKKLTPTTHIKQTQIHKYETTRTQRRRQANKDANTETHGQTHKYPNTSTNEHKY